MLKKKIKHKRKSHAQVPVTIAMPEFIGTYKVLDRLGKGGFGTVYSAFDPETGTTVAVKQIPIVKAAAAEMESIQMEIDLLQELSHTHIVQYVDVVREPKSLNIVLEYVESGQLSSFLARVGKVPESLLGSYIQQVLSGLEFLHSQGIIHRDIKGANILTTKEGFVKLADFGVATKLGDIGATTEDNCVGTPYWMAPEIIEMSHCPSTACDIWSTGCTLLELITGAPPYHDLNPMSACYRIVQDPLPPFPLDLSPDLQDFLARCFVKNPDERATASELLQHPWIVKCMDKKASLRLHHASPISLEDMSKPKAKANPNATAEKEVTQDEAKAAEPTEQQARRFAFMMEDLLAHGTLFDNVLSRTTDEEVKQERDLVVNATLDKLADFLREAPTVARKLIEKQAVYILMILLRHSNRFIVQDVLIVIYMTLNAPDQSESEKIVLWNAFLGMGLVRGFKGIAGPTNPTYTRTLVSALLRSWCFVDSTHFIAGGGVEVLANMLEVEYTQFDCHLAWNVVDCLNWTLRNALGKEQTGGLQSNDLCARYAEKFSFVDKILTLVGEVLQLGEYSINSKAHPKRAIDTHQNDRSCSSCQYGYSSWKESAAEISSLEPAFEHAAEESAVENASLGAAFEHAMVTFNEPLRYFLRPSTPQVPPQGSPVANASPKKRASSTAVSPSTLKSRKGRQAPRGSMPLSMQLRDGVDYLRTAKMMYKMSVILNTMSKAPVSRNFFCTKEKLEKMLSISSYIPDHLVSATLINCLAECVSSDSLALVLEEEPNITRDLVYCLKRFISLEGCKYEWTIADLLHIILKFSRQSPFHTKKGGNAGPLDQLVQHGMLPSLHWLLIQQDNALDLQEEGNTQAVHNDTAIKARDGIVKMIHFLFPVMYCIALAPFPNNPLFEFKPDLFFPFVSSPKFRPSIFEIYLCFTKAGKKSCSEFLCNPETINKIVEQVRCCGSSSLAKLLQTINKIVLLDSNFQNALADYDCYWEMLRDLLTTESAEKIGPAIHGIRLQALRSVHHLMVCSTKLDQITKQIKFQEVLLPLTEEGGAVIVQKMAKALLDHCADDNPNLTLSKREKKRQAKECAICKTTFRFPKHRKHYCKQCGYVVCAKCSPDKIIVRSVDTKVPKRVCNNCMAFERGSA